MISPASNLKGTCPRLSSVKTTASTREPRSCLVVAPCFPAHCGCSQQTVYSCVQDCHNIILCLFLVTGKLNSSENTRFCRTVKRWAICHTWCPIHTVPGNKVESAMPAQPEAAPRQLHAARGGRILQDGLAEVLLRHRGPLPPLDRSAHRTVPSGRCTAVVFLAVIFSRTVLHVFR